MSDRIILTYHPVAADIDEVPGDLLAATEVLYTNTVLPGLAQAPGLRWAQLDTSGIDHLRDSDLWNSNVTITTLGGVSPAPLAEWVLAMILMHAHRLRQTERLAARRHWPSREDRWSQLMPKDIRRSTVGIVGYGRIGREIARICQALGMRVLAVRRDAHSAAGDRFGQKDELDGVTVVGADRLHQILADSDYLVLTVPLTPATRGMIGTGEFDVMKKGSVLINASRGGVVDETALLRALDTGRLDHVASDVFAEEPLPVDSPFWTHPRSIVTPHIAGFAPDYVDVVGDLFTANLRRYLGNKPLLNVADRDRGY